MAGGISYPREQVWQTSDSPRTSVALAALPERSCLAMREISPTAQVQDCDFLLILGSRRMNGLLEKHPGPGGQTTQ